MLEKLGSGYCSDWAALRDDATTCIPRKARGLVFYHLFRGGHFTSSCDGDVKIRPRTICFRAMLVNRQKHGLEWPICRKSITTPIFH
jgi:hypothetical protein